MSETTPDVKNLHVVDGPLSRHKLAVLRDERTTTADFRQAMKELALILVGEATGNMPTRQVQIRAPLTSIWSSFSTRCSQRGGASRPPYTNSRKRERPGSPASTRSLRCQASNGFPASTPT